MKATVYGPAYDAVVKRAGMALSMAASIEELERVPGDTIVTHPDHGHQAPATAALEGYYALGDAIADELEHAASTFRAIFNPTED